MSIRILVADDHGVVRAGLRALLSTQPDFEVIGEAADSDEALQLANNLRPDLMLLDINMPSISGIEVLQQLKKRLPDIRVLMLTVHEDEALLRKSIRAGAWGYVIKRAAESELINAIRAVYQGDIYIHPSVTRALLKDLISSVRPEPIVDNLLTPRETEVLRLIVRGHTNNQVANIMKISSRTVEGHRASIMDKLNLHSRVELVEYAEQHGLLN
jgi:two-component system response regulator NreC